MECSLKVRRGGLIKRTRLRLDTWEQFITDLCPEGSCRVLCQKPLSGIEIKGEAEFNLLKDSAQENELIDLTIENHLMSDLIVELLRVPANRNFIIENLKILRNSYPSIEFTEIIPETIENPLKSTLDSLLTK